MGALSGKLGRSQRPSATSRLRALTGVKNLILACVLAGFALSSQARAFDGTPADDNDMALKKAFRSGAKKFKSGDMDGGLQQLEYAASRGHVWSMFFLARSYSNGDGIAKDDAKAFKFYQDIVEEHGEDSPDLPQARVVADAFVALGAYYLSGIPQANINADSAKALRMFEYAASYFGDSDAQYNLGRLYLEGAAEQPRDPVMAARWLRLVADKGQKQAQALLGNLLFSGDGIPRQAARGCMYVTLAKDNAKVDADQWILSLHQTVMDKILPAERDMCLTYLEQFMKNRS